MSSHAIARTAPRHRAVTLRESRRAMRQAMRASRRRHAAPRRSWVSLLLTSLPTLAAAALTVLALAASLPASATAPVRVDTIQPLVRVTTVAPEVVVLPAEHIEEDDPRWDCKTMGNRACGETRTDPRFPGVTFHYVVQYAPDGVTVEHDYTARQWQHLQGLPLDVSTATDRY